MAAPEIASVVAKKTPLWVWALLSISVVLMGAGVVMPLVGESHAAPQTPRAAPSTDPGLVGGFAAGQEADSTGAGNPSPTSDADGRSSPWAPAVFRLGFSFFLGFAIASALKFAFKMAMVVIGFFALALFGLQYAGLVEVKWGAIGDQYDSFAQWFTTQFASFQAFVTGYLPSAAAAGAGMLAGFIRK